MTFLERIAMKYQVTPSGHPHATLPGATPDEVARQYQQKFLMGTCEKRMIEQILRLKNADSRFTQGFQPSPFPLTEEK